MRLDCSFLVEVIATGGRPRMRESVDDPHKIFEFLRGAETDDIHSREIIMKGFAYSYYYETEE